MIRPGDVLMDRYRVLRALGGGGFGEAFLAEDGELGQVVVKVLHESSAPGLERMKQEFRLLSKLAHPAFARVYAAGIIPGGRPYLVMEWVDGDTIESLIQRSGRIPLADAIVVARALAEGLARVHDAGYVHRDVKPSNVMIPRGSSGPEFSRAKLMDFGVLGELLGHGQSRLTMTGMVVGTPRYMSPEQIQGLPQSTATDVYGLALLLTEMVYGRLPFEEEGGTAIALMVRVVQTDPVLPDDPAVPEELRALLARSLSRDPTHRPADGAAFGAELELVEPSQVVFFKDTGAVPRASAALVAARTRSSGRVARLSAPRALPTTPRLILVGVLLLATAVVVVAQLVGGRRGALQWIAGGVAVAAGSLLVANLVRRLARSRLHAVEGSVEDLLLGVRTKRTLTATLQLQVTQIIARCRALDERLLGVTILKMIGEFDTAKESGDRQSALMNVAALMEKLRGQLSPWYARSEKQLALATSFIGIVMGVLSVVAGVIKLARGEP